MRTQDICFCPCQVRDIIPYLGNLIKTQKASGVRHDVAVYLNCLMTKWPTSSLSKHQGILEASFKAIVVYAAAEAQLLPHWNIAHPMVAVVTGS